jgi:hypothetical protein
MKGKILSLAFAVGVLSVPRASGATVMVSGPLTHEYSVQPGRSYEGTIEVVNSTDAPQEIRVYQTDLLFFSDGSVHYRDPGSIPRSNARWIVYAPSQASVPIKDKLLVRYSIEVPDDAGLRGTYWSVFMVETVPPDSTGSGAPGKDGVSLGIRQVFRYAVQVVTHIGETGTRMLKFGAIRLLADGDRTLLLVDAENTGERLLRGSMWADVYDEAGGYAGRSEGDRHRLYPGTSVRFTAELKYVPGGKCKGLIVIDCGGGDVFGADVTLVLDR